MNRLLSVVFSSLELFLVLMFFNDVGLLIYAKNFRGAISHDHSQAKHPERSLDVKMSSF